MTCEERPNQVLLYAAGALDPDEAEEVREHLAGGCPQCAGYLAEAHAILGLLPFSLAPQAAPAAARQRFLARVEKESGVSSAQGPHPIRRPAVAPPSPMWWTQIVLPSAIAASVAALIVVFFAMRLNARAPEPAPVAVGDLEKTVGLLQGIAQSQAGELTRLRNADPLQTVQWAAGPELKIVSMSGTENQPQGARGRVFWDTDNGKWHFFASGLKPAAPGKTYELWYVSQDGKTALPAGSFNPNPEGNASLVSNVPKEMKNLAVAAVTDEPANAPITAPTGTFQLKGAMQ